MLAGPTSEILSYAPPEHRARRLLRRLRVPCVLVIVALVAWKASSPLWHRFSVAYWYHSAATYTPPAGQVAWNYTQPRGCLLISGPASPHRPVAWDRLYSLLSPPGFRTNGTAFLGQRSTQGGRDVLVAVDVVPDSNPVGDVAFQVRAIQPASPWRLPTQFIDSTVSVKIPEFRHLRIFAGTSDPADASHAMIGFQIDGRPGIIDVWLREDRVDVELRPPAFTPPPPASPG